MDSIPVEIKHGILEYLSPMDLNTLMCVNREYHKLADKPLLQQYKEIGCYLELACKKGYLELVKWLLGPENPYHSVQDSYSWIYACYSDNIELIKFLGDVTNINSISTKHYGMLAALKTGNLKTLKYLIDTHGAGIIVSPEDALETASSQPNTEIIQYLVEMFSPIARVVWTRMVDSAVIYGSYANYKTITDLYKNFSSDALYVSTCSAARGGNLDLYKIAEKFPREANITPLHEFYACCKNGNTELLQYIYSKYILNKYYVRYSTMLRVIITSGNIEAVNWMFREFGTPHNGMDSMHLSLATNTNLDFIKWIMQRCKISDHPDIVTAFVKWLFSVHCDKVALFELINLYADIVGYKTLPHNVHVSVLCSVIEKGDITTMQWYVDKMGISLTGYIENYQVDLLRSAILTGKVGIIRWLISLAPPVTLEDQDQLTSFAAYSGGPGTLEILINEFNYLYTKSEPDLGALITSYLPV